MNQNRPKRIDDHPDMSATGDAGELLRAARGGETLKLYMALNSQPSRAVWALVEAERLPIELRLVGGKGGLSFSDLVRVNANKTIPALEETKAGEWFGMGEHVTIMKSVIPQWQPECDPPRSFCRPPPALFAGFCCMPPVQLCCCLINPSREVPASNVGGQTSFNPRCCGV